MKEEKIERIINIDENTRIVVIPNNFCFEKKTINDKKDSKLYGQIQWIRDGYFPDMVSVCHFYIETAPRNSEMSIRSIRGVIKSIESAKDKILNALK